MEFIFYFNLDGQVGAKGEPTATLKYFSQNSDFDKDTPSTGMSNSSTDRRKDKPAGGGKKESARPVYVINLHDCDVIINHIQTEQRPADGMFIFRLIVNTSYVRC